MPKSWSQILWILNKLEINFQLFLFVIKREILGQNLYVLIEVQRFIISIKQRCGCGCRRHSFFHLCLGNDIGYVNVMAHDTPCMTHDTPKTRPE